MSISGGCGKVSEVIRFCWDACTWISFINEEDEIPTAGSSASENRLDMCRKTAEGVRRGQVELVTSTLTLAEVHKTSQLRNDRPLAEILDALNVRLIPVDAAVGYKAHALLANNPGALRPPDAVHVVSAQVTSVDALHTFDRKILRFDGKLLRADGEPLRICKPDWEPPSD